MDKMREEFEAWCDEQGYASDKYSSDDCGDKYKHLVGEYVISDTRFLWEAWKASRAALRVELPSKMSGEVLSLYGIGFNDGIDIAIECIEEAGVSRK